MCGKSQAPELKARSSRGSLCLRSTGFQGSKVNVIQYSHSIYFSESEPESVRSACTVPGEDCRRGSAARSECSQACHQTKQKQVYRHEVSRMTLLTQDEAFVGYIPQRSSPMHGACHGVPNAELCMKASHWIKLLQRRNFDKTS